MDFLSSLNVAVGGGTFFETVWSILSKNWEFLLYGAGFTLLLALTGTVIGFVIGLLVGIVRTIPVDGKSSIFRKIIVKFANIILSIYVEVFRGTPMIVQAMVIFYGYAALSGTRPDVILSGIIIVSINTGAYLAEVVRGGILSIDRGQFEAAHSIGMPHTKTMVNIILPQAIRNIMPALGNEFIINIKDTAVLNVISVTELFFQAKTVAANTYKYFEVFFVICVLYLIMTYGISRILRLVERKLEGPRTFTIHGSQTVPEAEIKVHLDDDMGRKVRNPGRAGFRGRDKGNW
jgi:putative lysine transport system permease protein